MSDYVSEAKEFLSRNKIEMKIVFKDQGTNKLWDDPSVRNRYSVSICNTVTDESMRVLFWDSVYNTQRHTTPTEYDILACLMKYEPGSYT